MRLWPYQMLDVLPSRQLTSQWRECLAVSGMLSTNKLNHGTVNRVKEYPIEHFAAYCDLVREEFNRRGFKIGQKTIEKLNLDINYSNLDYNTIKKYKNLIYYCEVNNSLLFENYHNQRHIKQCLYSFQERLDCSMITIDQWKILENKFSFLLSDILEN